MRWEKEEKENAIKFNKSTEYSILCHDVRILKWKERPNMRGRCNRDRVG